MSNKYTTIYVVDHELPIEKGTLIFNEYNVPVRIQEIDEKNNEVLTDEPDPNDMFGDSYYVLPLHQVKPIRMALVTYDLQPGDEFLTFVKGMMCSGTIESDGGDFWNVQSSFSGVRVLKSEAFKIIGPISKKAIWVKPSTTYISEDLRWALSYEDDEEDECFIEERVHHPNVEGFVKVICPSCLTFH